MENRRNLHAESLLQSQTSLNCCKPKEAECVRHLLQQQQLTWPEHDLKIVDVKTRVSKAKGVREARPNVDEIGLPNGKKV